MMRKLKLVVFIVLFGFKIQAQLVANLQFPSTGLLYKPQLWTMVLTNTTGAPLTLHIEVVLNESGSSQQVLSGVTRDFTLAPGTTQITPSFLFPVQYNSLSSSYIIDNSPNGLLPIGEFEACYNFFKHESDDFLQILEQCQEIIVEPLSPPQLIYPYDATAIEESNPQFSWLPPVPMAIFSSLNYDLLLVEISTNQTPTDAANQNVPLYQAHNLASNILLYPLSAPALEFGKQYAWKVVAKMGQSIVASTEVWEFTRKQYEALNLSNPTELPFVKLKKLPESSYAIFNTEIKFDYYNETADSSWRITISDLSLANKNEQPLQMEGFSLKQGQNLVRFPIEEGGYFVDKHLYEIEVRNSRNEKWKLRFQFRKSENPTN
jgi:hypothetical protein